MEPITIGLAGAAVLGLLALRKKKKGDAPQLPTGSDAAGFQGFAPGAQEKAWYMACSVQWTPSGSITDAAGKVALTHRGIFAGDKGDVLRQSNDLWFRGMMDKGYNIIVSDRIVIPEQGAAPYMAFVPQGFPASRIPGEWGPMLQLYAPPPGWLAQMNQGQGGGGVNPGPFPNGDPSDPFSEIPDATIRAKVKELYASDTAGLRDLEETAKELDKAGYPKSAAALRKRRDSLKLARSIDAQKAGGYLYVVRMNDLPINVAQHYGGKKPGVLAQMVKLNPTVAANKWKGWVEGAEVLLPVEWGDPQLKPLPPLASGKPAGGSSGGGSQPSGAPPYPVSRWYYGPGGEGPFMYNDDSQVPPSAQQFGWRDQFGKVHNYKWYAGADAAAVEIETSNIKAA